MTSFLVAAGDPAGGYGYVDDPVGTNARFNGPVGLDVNAAGDVLYVADFGNQVIRAVDLTGGGYGVTTFADLHGLSCPFPRWVSVSRSTGQIWVTSLNGSADNSAVLTIDPGTAVVTEWTFSGPDLYGSIMAGPAPQFGVSTPMAPYFGGGAVVKQHFHSEWRNISYDQEGDAFLDTENYPDLGCTPPDVFIPHIDGAFPGENSGMAWVVDQPDGFVSMRGHDYEYPSARAVCLIGNGIPVGGLDRHIPVCTTDPSTPIHSFQSAYGAPGPDRYPGYPLLCLCRGETGGAGTYFMQAPLHKSLAGCLFHIFYDETTEPWFDGTQDFVDGPTLVPAVGACYVADRFKTFLSSAFVNGYGSPGSVDVAGLYNGIPYNTVGFIGTPVGALHVERHLVSSDVTPLHVERHLVSISRPYTPRVQIVQEVCGAPSAGARVAASFPVPVGAGSLVVVLFASEGVSLPGPFQIDGQAATPIAVGDESAPGAVYAAVFAGEAGDTTVSAVYPDSLSSWVVGLVELAGEAHIPPYLTYSTSGGGGTTVATPGWAAADTGVVYGLFLQSDPVESAPFAIPGWEVVCAGISVYRYTLARRPIAVAGVQAPELSSWDVGAGFGWVSLVIPFYDIALRERPGAGYAANSGGVAVTPGRVEPPNPVDPFIPDPNPLPLPPTEIELPLPPWIPGPGPWRED